MTITTGDSLPDTKLVKVTEGGPEQVSAADYFKGRKVALFSVPGAFTPTCSAKHLPGFVDKADELKAKGVDEIVCTAVNDAFVMGAWGKSASAGDSVRYGGPDESGPLPLLVAVQVPRLTRHELPPLRPLRGHGFEHEAGAAVIRVALPAGRVRLEPLR